MYPTIAYISLPNLRHNLCQIQIKSRVDAQWAVVKANAYGHGAVEVANALKSMVCGVCVATIPEAIQLRKNGFEERILVMGAPLPQWLKHYGNYKLEVNVANLETANLLQNGAACGLSFDAHVKLDTGMKRLGLSETEILQANEWLTHPNIQKKGLWTHFAVADEIENEFNETQIQRFIAHTAAFMQDYEQIHLGNSAASLYLSHKIPQNRLAFRAGLALYGISPAQELDNLKPVMTLKSVVVQTKFIAKGTTVSYGQQWTAHQDTNIAIVNAGYADGFPREIAENTCILINEERFPIVGRVCMDMMMVDIGNANVVIGDAAELWGEHLPIWEIANAAQSIPYTHLTHVPQRVKRIYLG